MPVIEFKVVVIGSVAVGKTSITNRLQYSQFEEEYQPTVGAGYVSYRTSCDGQDVELQIWDTAGMERYRSLGPIYYRDAVAAIIVYDQTDQNSAEALQKWLAAFRQTVKGSAYVAIAANKDDVEEKTVDPEPIRLWATENHFDFFFTSAKNGKGVDEMFQALVRSLVASTSAAPADPKTTQQLVSPDSAPAVTSSCC
jgi:small GTP-binding protein